MDIELIQYIGQIKNDTNVLGKAFLFNVIDTTCFECVLFVHPTVDSFISVTDNTINKQQILDIIFNKYTKQQLLEVQ